MTEVLGEFLLPSGLEDSLGELLHNPSGPVNDKPCSFAWRTNSRAAASPADSFLLAMLSSVAVITAPFPAHHEVDVSGRTHR